MQQMFCNYERTIKTPCNYSQKEKYQKDFDKLYTRKLLSGIYKNFGAWKLNFYYYEFPLWESPYAVNYNAEQRNYFVSHAIKLHFVTPSQIILLGQIPCFIRSRMSCGNLALLVVISNLVPPCSLEIHFDA